mmetsp:Transcript_59059/g.127773  ORF Transcript_59059/g.127773 Transcript_59059/m.127773 type:complete len:263 (+) Transcript_59059:648-1436(+)
MPTLQVQSLCLPLPGQPLLWPSLWLQPWPQPFLWTVPKILQFRPRQRQRPPRSSRCVLEVAVALLATRCKGNPPPCPGPSRAARRMAYAQAAAWCSNQPRLRRSQSKGAHSSSPSSPLAPGPGRHRRRPLLPLKPCSWLQTVLCLDGACRPRGSTEVLGLRGPLARHQNRLRRAHCLSPPCPSAPCPSAPGHPLSPSWPSALLRRVPRTRGLPHPSVPSPQAPGEASGAHPCRPLSQQSWPPLVKQQMPGCVSRRPHGTSSR